MTSVSARAAWRRLVPIQFIAALGPPDANSGKNANAWGLWRVDPGPRGVPIASFPASGKGWTLNPAELWVEEHGRLMESPEPLPPGRYLVTGDREKTVPLTVSADGAWSLDGATLFEVTHLPCRSARYVGSAASSAIANASRSFPVKPGALMPPIAGYDHQDYAVVFVLAVEE
jgi:hypothetical protein